MAPVTEAAKISVPADRHLLALMRVPGLGPMRGRRLLRRLGSAAGIFAAGPGAWREAGCGEAACAALATPDWPRIDADLEWLDAPGHHFIPHDDPRYPSQLGEIAAAPLALYAVGDPDLLPLPQLGIVGARSASSGGRETATEFAAELTRRGLIVTSGLALGIDGAAHRGALAANGLTIAVCGNGLDRAYPWRHRELAEEIAAKGLLVSEFPPGTAPKPEHFPRRNRIISGLALGVLVVEAARESGSLITARLAAEQGREVFAVPGSIHNPLARGTHALIRDGATLTESVDDILQVLAPLLPGVLPASAGTGKPAAAPVEADSPAGRVLAALGHEARDVDTLVAATGLPAAALSVVLLELELDGRIDLDAGSRYRRRPD